MIKLDNIFIKKVFNFKYKNIKYYKNNTIFC